MKALTSRERLTRIFRGEEIDRPSLKLWGFQPGQGMLHPDYEPVYRRAAELSDWFAGADSPFYLAGGQNYEKLVTYDYKPLSDLWKECIVTYHTPKGNLTERHMVSTVNAPGYTTEHPVKEPEDLEALLSLPYEPFPFQAKSYFDTEARVGDKGVTMFGIDHTA
jgi:hypothetical protein